jgi:methylenetetrahydrofolate dehydrogenase (NADP+) / methenyltetrahydrofolate cyclohydrolase
MQLLEGQKIAEKILQKLKKKISGVKKTPGLAVILVGEDKASQTYVKLKEKAAKEVGINFYKFAFKKNISEKIILQKITELNASPEIDGIIVQLPLPTGLHTSKIIQSISLAKDVDGFSAQKNKQNVLCPVFPSAILKLLLSSRKKLKNKKAVILANSKIFGETLSAVLKKQSIQASHILFKDLKNNLSKIKKADVLISAVGQAGFLKGEMVKKSVIIIDGGIIKKGKKVFGDVDRQSVSEKAAFLSPVPGGVGPVTIACLLENVYLARLNK